MEKKSIGFGARGTMLLIYQFLAYCAYCAFTNFPQNLLSDFFGGTNVTTLMNLIGSMLGYVITYFVVAPNIGKIKNMKRVGIIIGLVSLVFCAGVCLIPAEQRVLWCICFVCVLITTQLWACFFVTQLIGNWFPRRKGTVMGIVTMAFPLVTGICLGLFASHFFGMVFGQGVDFTLARVIAFSPYWIAGLVAIIVCALFLKDFPEQCGAYRDNDKSFTPEMANEMLMKELEARKNSCWKRSKIWGCKDWWMQAIPTALLLACAMAFMVQIMPVLQSKGDALNVLAIPGFSLMADGYNAVLFGLSIFAMFGSWLLGVLDTKYGTKTAVFITSIIMLIAGGLGMIDNIWCTVAACWLLGLFMGASSNFGLSSIVRYWRLEDYPSVMSGAPPVSTIIGAGFPFLVSVISRIGLTPEQINDLNNGVEGAVANYKYSFLFVAIMAVVCIVCNRLFSPRGIAEYDRKLRIEAGLEPDNVLFDRLDMEKRQNAKA